MQNKASQIQGYIGQFIYRLQDVKFAGQVLFVVIVLLISWSGVKAIQTNYELQKQIAAQRQRNQLQQLQNDNLRLENQYYSTDTYLDLSARQNFGLASPGETEVIVPTSVAARYIVDLPKPQAADKPADKQSTMQRNFQEWVNFFLHRGPAAR